MNENPVSDKTNEGTNEGDVQGLTPVGAEVYEAAAEVQTGFKFADEALKAIIEAIIYVAPEPVPLEALVKVLAGEDRERIKLKLEELIRDFEGREHGIQIRAVAGGYKFSSKAEHHEILRKFVKSLKPPIRLSKPALETLAVVAYRQPVTLPEIEAIRGVDCGGVIHTLLERKLIITAGRKNVIGRPILYRTSRDFLMHFGLKDVSELPSLREFEELARQALGSELLSSSQEPALPLDASGEAGQTADEPVQAEGESIVSTGQKGDDASQEGANASQEGDGAGESAEASETPDASSNHNADSV